MIDAQEREIRQLLTGNDGMWIVFDQGRFVGYAVRQVAHFQGRFPGLWAVVHLGLDVTVDVYHAAD